MLTEHHPRRTVHFGAVLVRGLAPTLGSLVRVVEVDELGEGAAIEDVVVSKVVASDFHLRHLLVRLARLQAEVARASVLVTVFTARIAACALARMVSQLASALLVRDVRVRKRLLTGAFAVGPRHLVVRALAALAAELAVAAVQERLLVESGLEALDTQVSVVVELGLRDLVDVVLVVDALHLLQLLLLAQSSRVGGHRSKRSA